MLNFTDLDVVITGAASGMGAETASLLLAAGARVHTLDVAAVEAPVASQQLCDLGDIASIDAAVAHLPDRVDVLMNCAGVPNGGRFSGREVLAINWLGLRHLTESLLPRIPEGGSVVHISSTAGRAWADRVAVHDELMAAASYGEGLAWAEAHPDEVGDGYVLSKEAVQFYTLWRSVQTLSLGVRMNSVSPGITATAIIDDFRRGMGDELIAHAEALAGRMAHPREMAPAMLFLADQASASYINGVILNIDRGTGAARASGQNDPTILWPDGPPPPSQETSS